MIKQGFFAIIDNEYIGPFEKLNEARDKARNVGSDIPIFHGKLDGDKFEGGLVPKVQKG
jgi:hypothetical protein